MSEEQVQGNETKITSIEQQKKNRSRYNVYVNDEFAFAVHEDILVKYRLMKGREIDSAEMKEVLLAEERHRATQYAMRFLSFRPRTSAEVKEYLQKKGFLSEDIDSAITFLLEKNYLDDQTYALQWVEERKRLKPRGRYLLRMELMQRGIEDNIADQAIQGHLSGREEKEMVIQWIEKKCKGVKYPNLYEMKKKLVPFLQRKGFPLEVIMEGIHAVGDRYME
ncbi:RecX family transcriptional regulator [Ammoniphilus sp. 3BR4]|uniref:RecX family transcriptional regulator n=1 Tax=Ammoniphilus sp. 3BR4 TaxID=3158265 RepID=UPI0034679D48